MEGAKRTPGAHDIRHKINSEGLHYVGSASDLRYSVVVIPA